VIVCLRTVYVPPEQHDQFPDWIDNNGALRRQHGILAELVVARAVRQNPAKSLQSSDGTSDPDEYVVLTAWRDHDTFDAWINTPDRDRLTASPTHEAVEYRPITRYDVIGGYLADTLDTLDPTGGHP
jgi:heme-degrading monooxygenase HmoA